MSTEIPFPTSAEILHYIEQNRGEVTRRELARAFKITANNRNNLRHIIRQLCEDGHLQIFRNKLSRLPLPKILIVVISEIDERGNILARPDAGHLAGLIHIQENEKTYHRIGDRLKVRIEEKLESYAYTAKIIETITNQTTRITGVYTCHPQGDFIEPTERGWPPKISVDGNGHHPKSGDIVLAKISQKHRTFHATVEEILGHCTDSHILGLITLHNYKLPLAFHPDALNEAEKGTIPTIADRVDLRNMPLVTVDGAHARDFDDAIFAEPDPDNPDGWHLVVAIADVSYYVQPNSALDREAQNRGNSVYFPDRVVPMLPEKLSNDLCSLKPHEDRACLAVHLWIDKNGIRKRYKFVRALMRSHARLTYQQVQNHLDGREIDAPKGFDTVQLNHLLGAYHALRRARQHRGTLNVDLPETEIHVDSTTEETSFATADRYDSHRIIEEFMILANVAAAHMLQQHKTQAIYRTHEIPDPLKIKELRDTLKALGVPLPKGEIREPKHLDQILQHVSDSPLQRLVSKLVLRTQTRAIYNPENQGHFGLNLPQYAHFTSPIRRYADFVVHRAILHAMGREKHTPFNRPEVERIANHITQREHQADMAERSLRERYMINYLKGHRGGSFKGIIDGVTKFGLYVELDDYPASGFVPRETLLGDRYSYDHKTNRMVGQRGKHIWSLGDIVVVTVVEADPLRKKLLLAIKKRLQSVAEIALH
ncbi:MAG: ribonuclease R [Alphaproteobacteria bacterium]|nr:MAG: ribonuclease R [Alphaproteobacteria bacterium]